MEPGAIFLRTALIYSTFPCADDDRAPSSDAQKQTRGARVSHEVELQHYNNAIKAVCVSVSESSH